MTINCSSADCGNGDSQNTDDSHFFLKKALQTQGGVYQPMYQNLQSFSGTGNIDCAGATDCGNNDTATTTTTTTNVKTRVAIALNEEIERLKNLQMTVNCNGADCGNGD